MNRHLVAAIIVVLGFIIAIFSMKAHARDNGQWENTDPKIHEWYKSLMMPDVPTAPCCAEADAYYADKVIVHDDKVYAVVTDTRPDGPLGRPHIDPGSEFEVPPTKLKWDSSNPTGHNVLFVSRGGYTYCFVQGTGT